MASLGCVKHGADNFFFLTFSIVLVSFFMINCDRVDIPIIESISGQYSPMIACFSSGGHTIISLVYESPNIHKIE